MPLSRGMCNPNTQQVSRCPSEMCIDDCHLSLCAAVKSVIVLHRLFIFIVEPLSLPLFQGKNYAEIIADLLWIGWITSFYFFLSCLRLS